MNVSVIKQQCELSYAWQEDYSSFENSSSLKEGEIKYKLTACEISL